MNRVCGLYEMKFRRWAFFGLGARPHPAARCFFGRDDPPQAGRGGDALPPLDGEAVPDAARLEPGAGVEPGRRRGRGGRAAGVLTCRF